MHYHIFKNAGTSIDALLKKSFGDDWVSFEGKHATDVMSAHQLREFIMSNPQIRAVSSHLARPPLPGVNCRPIVFLRHPAVRAKSVFNFVCTDQTQPNSSLARSLGFRGYVQWALEGGEGGVVIRNYQVIHLSEATFRNGDILKASATLRDYECACRLLDEWRIFGLVKWFDMSIALFQKVYSPIFPEINFESIWLNRTEKRCLSEQQAIENVRHQLGDSLFDQLMANNELDMKLYEFGKERFFALCEAAGIQKSRTPQPVFPVLFKRAATFVADMQQMMLL